MVGGVKMNHYLFDALKISPVPLETANKVTETGWMLKIEKILNDLLLNADKKYDDLSANAKKEIADSLAKLQENINKVIYSNIYSDAMTERIVTTLTELLGQSLKKITFGLDENGYFYADIPMAMSDLEFETMTDDQNYGKLMIKY